MQECQETVLVVAAREGSVQIVGKLVQHGATANLTSKVSRLVGWVLILAVVICVGQVKTGIGMESEVETEADTCLWKCFHHGAGFT